MKQAVCISVCRNPQMKSWLVYLMSKVKISVVWHAAEREGSHSANQLCSLVGERCEYMLGWTESIEGAGISALIGSRMGMSGVFLTSVGADRIYIASFSKGDTHSELIRPVDMALPSFGTLFTEGTADSASCISYGAFLLRAVGAAQNLLDGADRVRHVLYDIENASESWYIGNRK